jgi:hypothetical protein
MANLPPLVAELIAKTDGFQAGLTRAAEAARKSSGDITGAFEKIQGALGAIGVGLSAAALGAAVKNTTDLGDEIFKMSQRVGSSVEELSTLRYAFDLAGVSMEDMDGLLVKLNKKLGEAGAGSAEAGQFLKQFGINVAEIKNGTLTTDEALKRIADRFATTPDGINKTAAAMELFGKAGAKVIPFLNAGRDGIEGLQTEADKLGLKLSTETAQRMEAFNDQLRTLEFASEGAKAAIVGSMLPALEQITKAMRDATIEGGKFAGIMAGVQTALTGGDQYKNDKRLVELTEKKLQLENDIAAAQRQGNQVRVNTFSGELARVEAELKTTLTYRKSLEETSQAEEAAAKRREALKTGGKQLEGAGPAKTVKVAKDRTSEFEREARAIVEGEERAVQDITEAWQAWEKQQVKDSEETTKALAEQWKQVFAEIDAEQERAIDDGRQYLESLKTDTKEASKFARDLGLTFSSAFEDAVAGGKKFSDVLNGLISDLARIVTRKTLTEPLGDAVSGMFKDFLPGRAEQLSGPSGGGGFWDSLTSWLPKFATGTNYVPQDMVAMVHKGERIIPAAENRAGGGGITIVQNINIDSRSDQASIRQAMVVAKEEAKSEIMDSRMRGGAFA